MLRSHLVLKLVTYLLAPGMTLIRNIDDSSYSHEETAKYSRGSGKVVRVGGIGEIHNSIKALSAILRAGPLRNEAPGTNRYLIPNPNCARSLVVYINRYSCSKHVQESCMYLYLYIYISTLLFQIP